MKVNQNISAVISNNQLLRTEGNLSDSIERLSSGFRINHAKDDPAGIAISNKMQQQIDGLSQASRNAQDGTSVLNTADGALNEVTSVIQRMRELSVQAASDSNTPQDKAAIQEEMEALNKEIDRISTDTEFNTKTLLDGTLDTRVYVDGASRISVSDYVDSGEYVVSVSQVGKQAEISNSSIVDDIKALAAAGTDSTVNVNGYKVDISASDSDEAIVEKIRTAAEKGEAVMTADMDAATPPAPTGTYSFASAAYGKSAELTMSYSYVDGTGTTVTEYYDATGTASTTASTQYGDDAKITLGAGYSNTATAVIEGNRVSITDKDGFSMNFLIDSDLQFPAGGGDATLDFDVTEMGTMDIQVGTNENQIISVRIPAITTESLYTDDIDVTTITGAARAIGVLDDALATVTAARSKIGAYTNRLDYATNTLDQTNEDLTSAISRIKDIDMATEMTNYAQQQVLQQAATSVLSQANDLPQQVLQLLRQ